MAKTAVATIDPKYLKGYVKMKLSNVTVHWAHLLKPDTAFNGNKWHLTASLSDELAEALRKEGFTIVDKGTIKNVLKVKKEALTAKGVANEPPFIVGPDGRTPFTQEVGNGSICNLLISAKAWTVRGATMISAYLDGVQVVSHVPYSSGFEDVSGNVPF